MSTPHKPTWAWLISARFPRGEAPDNAWLTFEQATGGKMTWFGAHGPRGHHYTVWARDDAERDRVTALVRHLGGQTTAAPWMTDDAQREAITDALQAAWAFGPAEEPASAKEEAAVLAELEEVLRAGGFEVVIMQAPTLH